MPDLAVCVTPAALQESEQRLIDRLEAELRGTTEALILVQAGFQAQRGQLTAIAATLGAVEQTVEGYRLTVEALSQFFGSLQRRIEALEGHDPRA